MASQTRSTYLSIEHLALGAQTIALRHQVVDLLSAREHALDSVVQHDLGLIQLFLNLHNAVNLSRVLVLCDILLELGIWQREGLGFGEDGARVFGEEFVTDLGEYLLRNELRVLGVCYYDSADAFLTGVGMNVVC